MKELVLKLFWKRFKSINISHVVNASLIFIYALTFPMLADQQKTLMEFVKSMPEGFLKAFGIDASTMMTFESYLASKHIIPIWVIILLIVVIPAATFISKSISNNTSELLFSQPISRIKSSLSVLISAVIQSLYFTVPSILICIPVSWLFNIDVAYSNYAMFTISAIAFSFVFTCLIFLLDVLIGDSGKVSGLIIIFTIGSYALDILSKVISDLDFLKYFSFFHYFDANASLGSGQIEWWYVVGFILLGIVFSALAIWRFNKKDISK